MKIVVNIYTLCKFNSYSMSLDRCYNTDDREVQNFVKAVGSCEIKK